MKKIQRMTGNVLVLCLIVSALFTVPPETVFADVLSNAYEFYEAYGNEMLFQKGSDLKGEIYYATKAKRANTGIQYTTLGWKITVKNNMDMVADILYYQLGGENMVCVDVRNKNGYEYCLYRVSLENMKSRMGNSAKIALTLADAKIIFDACTTTKINGKVQGAMTDDGPSEGVVYETYTGIANAQNWSDATKETLKSYYNKVVSGLFHSIMVTAGEGISSVRGKGRYCFGAEVVISAKVEEGYHFLKWTGSKPLSGQETTYVMGDEDVSFCAVAEMNQYSIVFHSNGGTGQIPTINARYSQQVQLPKEGFYLEGCCLRGWSSNKAALEPEYALNESIDMTALVKKKRLVNVNNGTITLYAVWDRAPVISGDEIYVSLSDAQSGKVTESWIAGYVGAQDAEDGNIPYGQNEKNSFLLVDYKATDFTEFKKDGSVTETLCAIDSSGNETRKRIMIHVVDTTIYDAEIFAGTPRFISAEYYKNDNGAFVEEAYGGLKRNSCWRLNTSYTTVLDALFQE